MRLKITLLFAFVMLAVTNTYAGFPVQRTAVAAVNGVTLTEDDHAEVLTSPAAVEADRQLIAILLWLFLGGFAAHRWYLGSPIGWNILFILTAGFFVVGWVIDGIEILTGSYPGL
ncbi:TM2 domain-containing protein [Dokdonia sp. Hel_I_63]|uniref:TM2 domain-containing protein n=1 Tax=Dokdonia sp. Hel_I_63 TaxID=1249996 RepID=UPI00119BCA29|nr:TM2 domain-containing protein [Dokdonia sp. Hel_I_63]TVZ21409.1 TM2 domain-containing protein [Dokdonia sp. Hel_I_63]